MSNVATAIISFFSQLLKFLNDLNDPKKREVRLKQADAKRYKLAIEYAERFIFATRDMEAAVKPNLKAALKRKRSKWETKFFKYNN